MAKKACRHRRYIYCGHPFSTDGSRFDLSRWWCLECGSLGEKAGLGYRRRWTKPKSMEVKT